MKINRILSVKHLNICYSSSDYNYVDSGVPSLHSIGIFDTDCKASSIMRYRNMDYNSDHKLMKYVCFNYVYRAANR